MPFVNAECWRGTALSRPWLLAAGLFASSFAAAVVYPLTRPEEWVGWMPSTISASELAAVWAPSLAAVGSAFVIGQPHSVGLSELSDVSPRTAPDRLKPGLVLVTISVVLGQVLAVVLLLGISLRFGLTEGALLPKLLLSIPTVSANLAFWIAVGGVLGRSLARAIALPLAGVSPYVVYSMLAFYFSDSPLAVLAVGDARVYDYVSPTTANLWARGIFWGFAAAAAWTFLLGRVRVSRAATWLASIAASVALFQGAAFVEVPGAVAAHCVGTVPVTCLDGSHANVSNAYRSSIAALWTDIPAALRPQIVTSSEEFLLDSKSYGIVVPPVFGYTEPSRLIDHEMFSSRLGDALFLEPCRTSGRDSDAATTLVIWWRLTHAIPLDGSAFVGDTNYEAVVEDYALRHADAVRLLNASSEARSVWFKANAEAVRTCTLTGFAEI